MPEQDPPRWCQYEIDVAEMLASFEDVSVVEHDATRQGRVSQRSRQIDVWVEGTVAGFSVAVAVECKLLTDPVGIGLVDEFHGKLVDLGADKGVMYSNSGFTDPALARADAGRQRQPTIALLEQSARFDYSRFLGPDCPNDNCYSGSIGWNSNVIERIPEDPSVFQAGSCDSCGGWAARCGICGSVNMFFWDKVECEGCGASWEIEYDRDRIESVVRQLTDSDGATLPSD